MTTEVDQWRTEHSEQLADCRVFTVRRDRKVRMSAAASRAGQQHDFFVIDSPDWINVVALTANDELVLIEQYRQGTDSLTLEVPGGLVDPGETALQAAVRELREETGYVAEQWVHLGTTEPNPAIQSNRLDTFLALSAEQAEVPQFDRTEHIKVHLRTLDSAFDLIDSGHIRHALVIVALHRVARHLR